MESASDSVSVFLVVFIGFVQLALAVPFLEPFEQLREHGRDCA
jgi:hypothetical protein